MGCPAVFADLRGMAAYHSLRPGIFKDGFLLQCQPVYADHFQFIVPCAGRDDFSQHLDAPAKTKKRFLGLDAHPHFRVASGAFYSCFFERDAGFGRTDPVNVQSQDGVLGLGKKEDDSSAPLPRFLKQGKSLGRDFAYLTEGAFQRTISRVARFQREGELEKRFPN